MGSPSACAHGVVSASGLLLPDNGIVRRWLIAILIGVGVAAAFVGLPIALFFATHPAAFKWQALIPNLLLLVLIGAPSAGIYLFFTRGQ